MTTVVGPPTAVRVARAILIAQTAAAGLITGIAVVLFAAFGQGEARQDDYAGAVAGLGAFFAVVFGVFTLALGTAAVGLWRSRTWGLIGAGVTETLLVMFVARPAVHGLSPVVWLLVIAPAVTVLVLVLKPQSRNWCRTRPLA